MVTAMATFRPHRWRVVVMLGAVSWPMGAHADEPPWRASETVDVATGDLEVQFRDNSQSPAVLSGVDSLVNVRDAPGFDAFDPDSRGASAGLNFEHIICGHKSPHNAFAPRHHKFELSAAPTGSATRLSRDERDDPWSMSSTMTYTVVPPHAIDIEFRCRVHDPALFGERGYAVLFFANYMNDMDQIAMHFLGKRSADEDEQWITADAPPAHADYNGGGTYRSILAAALEYDEDHNFKLNLWSYDGPRFTRPFYYGRAARGMTLVMMFDKADGDHDEIRFSLFKFKTNKVPRPALDWQYVIHHVQAGRQYGFRARLVWKAFVSPDDCLREYEQWQSGLAKGP
jgi:hypothetical protein